MQTVVIAWVAFGWFWISSMIHPIVVAVGTAIFCWSWISDDDRHHRVIAARAVIAATAGFGWGHFLSAFHNVIVLSAIGAVVGWRWFSLSVDSLWGPAPRQSHPRPIYKMDHKPYQFHATSQQSYHPMHTKHSKFNYCKSVDNFSEVVVLGGQWGPAI